ncbi:MAG: type VI secretion system tip protein VgrG [Polyangiaceae bacterium]|nr:type VI secretion system tip protein VgrG [Polyangiaceae bacterium]
MPLSRRVAACPLRSSRASGSPSRGIRTSARSTSSQSPRYATAERRPRTRSTRTNSNACPPRCPIWPKSGERTVIQATLTATVVGPPGEEVHVDGAGRIKVHFHWDRVSPNADSSCWIRCLQAWGGAGWGAQFIPRVGMEVVVGFDGGDPDRPIVLGCLYNATHPMPFALPRDKTRSGIRTRSVPGTAGSNELSFEDARGGADLRARGARPRRRREERPLGSRG